MMIPDVIAIEAETADALFHFACRTKVQLSAEAPLLTVNSIACQTSFPFRKPD